ncbi:MAG: flagellar hook-length control protein FliK [Nitrospinae bacterium]|nr:flagellar hook-length control protein FliK [Nitrospinota bacterium]
MSQTPFNGNDQDSPLAGEPEDTGGRAGRKAPASSAPPTGYADALAKPPPASAGPKGFAHELAPSSSGHVPDPLPLITQLTDRMYVAIKDGQQELRVVLTPENLGTVRVEIATNEGDMTARLLVDNPLVKDLVEGNLNRLKDALLAQGLQLQDIAVSVSHHFMQRESSGRNLPFGEPGWKAQQRHTPDGPAREIPGTSNGARSSPDSLLVDLFV